MSYQADAFSDHNYTYHESIRCPERKWRHHEVEVKGDLDAGGRKSPVRDGFALQAELQIVERTFDDQHIVDDRHCT